MQMGKSRQEKSGSGGSKQKTVSTHATNPRWIALQVMLQVVEQGRSLDSVFQSDWFKSLPAEKRDLALSREIVFGLCRWYVLLESLLAGRLQKPIRARDRDIEIVLLIGLYQILIMRTEAHAAVNETVKLVLAQKKKWASGLVNAVLRGVLRDQLELGADADTRAYPPWMRTRLQADWNEQATEIMIAGNKRPPMTLRLDTRASDVESGLKQLLENGFEASRHETIDGAIVLASPCDVTELPGFEQGLFSVQDAAAQLAGQLLVCVPGARVLDACAAPGGKTIHLLQRYPGIKLDALDSSAARLERLQQNLQRSGCSAQILVGDAAAAGDWFEGAPYDAILADVPCSGSGVLRRHPDIKLLRRESDIISLCAQQAEILEALWPVLRPGGKMLYSTCSVFKDENENQVSGFLQRHPDAQEIPLNDANWGQLRPHGRQILPGGNMDGFYYALLSKLPES